MRWIWVRNRELYLHLCWDIRSLTWLHCDLWRTQGHWTYNNMFFPQSNLSKSVLSGVYINILQLKDIRLTNDGFQCPDCKNLSCYHFLSNVTLAEPDYLNRIRENCQRSQSASLGINYIISLPITHQSHIPIPPQKYQFQLHNNSM